MAIQDPVKLLKPFPLFRGFSPELLRRIVEVAEERGYHVLDVIFRQGDPPTHLYILLGGQVIETCDGPTGPRLPRLQLSSGSVLGRWSVVNDEPHETTATVVQDAAVLAMRKADVHALMAQFPLFRQRLGRADVVGRLRAIPLFRSFSEEELFRVADLAEPVEFAAGETIFRQGEPAMQFFVIDTGRVVETVTGPAHGSGSWPKYFSAGSFFGLHSLMHATTRRATAKAETRVKAYAFPVSAFHWLRQLQPDFEPALERTDLVPLLRRVPIFSGFKDADLQRLAGYVGLAYFPADHTIVYQGEVDPTFYQLYEGEADRLFKDERGRERKLDPLRAGQGEGERCLLLEEPWRFSLRTTTPSCWLYLFRGDLDQFLLQFPDLKQNLARGDTSSAGTRGKLSSWADYDEQVQMRRRRHVIALFWALLGWPGLVWLIPSIVLLLLLPGWLKVLAVLAALGWCLWCVIDWSNDYLVVTNKRVLTRERVVLIREKVEELPLSKIQNVGIQQGFLGNLLGFGRLTVETAATAGEQPLHFRFTPNPAEVKALIFEGMEGFRERNQPQARRLIREQVEASTRPGIRPIVPKPVAPPSVPVTGQGRKGLLARAYGATLGKAFWVQKADGDQITWRKHPLRLLVKVWIPTLAIVLILATALVLPISLVLLPPLAFWWWWRWADWGNDLYIVTTDRIIDTERLPLGFKSKRREAPFDRVQNVTYELPDLISNLLNFGTVSIYTAGVEGKLDFPYVSNPKKVQAEIFRRLTAYEETQRRRQQEQDHLADWFAVYDQTR